MNSKSKWCSIDLGAAAAHKNSPAPRGDASDLQIFVGGLKLTVTDAQLRGRFVEAFGDVAEARVMRFRDGRSRGFGFVKFHRSADYRRALDMQHMDFDGNLIEFRASISKEQAAKEAKELLKRKLILHHMPYEMTESWFLDYFNMYGEIVRVKIFRDMYNFQANGEGYVQFKEESAAESALEALTENPLRLGGNKVFACTALAKMMMFGNRPIKKTWHRFPSQARWYQPTEKGLKSSLRPVTVKPAGAYLKPTSSAECDTNYRFNICTKSTGFKFKKRRCQNMVVNPNQN